MMHNMDVLIKLPGKVSGNRLSIIHKIAFLNQYAWEFNLHSLNMYNNTMSTSGTWNSSYICTSVKKNQPILVRVLQAYQTFFFHLEFCLPLKTNFSANNLFVACRHRGHQNSTMIDWFVENWEACSLLAPCGSRIIKFLIHDWFVR